MFCLDTNVIIFAMNRRNPVIVARLSTELRAGTTLIVPAIGIFASVIGVVVVRARTRGRLSARAT